VGGITLIAELEGRIPAKPGMMMTLGFDLNRLLFFDSETQLAIY